MNSLNIFFDKIYCINLDRRNDRWDRVSKQFNNFGIILERFAAIDGKNIKHDTPLKDSVYGFSKSHLKIVEKCKEDGIKNVLIFEDDVVINENLFNLFEQHFNYEIIWDMIYFGCYNICKPIKISNNLCKIIRSYATHAYAINNSIFDKILQFDYTKPYDVYLSEIQNQFNCYLLIDVDGNQLTTQHPDFSDIENRFVNYTDILKKI